jgi:putative transposase
LLGISRSCVYYKSHRKQETGTIPVGLLQDLAEKFPFYGYRKLARELQRKGLPVTEKQTRTSLHRLHMRALVPKRNTSRNNPLHPVCPYLLKGKAIRYPNQVWAADITYIKLSGTGTVYLVAIVDLYSRKVLSWRLSNSMDSGFCEEALEEALEEYGCPAIFNTDQGSQFTGLAFLRMLKARGIRISMDGKERWRDNIYVERLWKTVKYEAVYLHAYEDIRSARRDLKEYFRFYNENRQHQSLGYETPDQRYASFQGYKKAV